MIVPRRPLTLLLTLTVTVGVLAVETSGFVPPVSAQTVAAQPVSAQPVSAQPVPARRDSAQPDSVRPGPADSTRIPIVVTANAPLDAATVAHATAGGGRVVETIDAIGTTVVEVPASLAIDTARRFQAVPGVTSAQRDQQVHAFDVTPNDPYWSAQSSLRDVGVPAAWASSVGSPSVVIGVVDSGVDEVADLSGRVLTGHNFVDPTDSSDATDSYGHGTATALVAAAAGNDSAGLAGVCWSCRILPVKVLDDDGLGSMSDVAGGIVWATDHGADIINLSLGGSNREPAVTAALSYAYSHDVVVVASAGNDGRSDPSYPAAEPGVLAVGGIANGTRVLKDSSRRGPTWVDLAAPWCNLVFLAGSPDSFCGTSSAAPVVTGVAALLRSIRPAADRNTVATALLTTADFAPTRGQVGYGILNAAAAASAIVEAPAGPPPLPADVTAPAVSIWVPGGYVGGIARTRVTADDDQGVVVDELWVDGTQVASAANPARVAALDFDTRPFGDGAHTVVAFTSDAAGHRVASAAASIVIDNVNPLGILTSPTHGARVSGRLVARVYVTDPNGIMGTFLVANDRIIGGFQGAGWGEASMVVARPGAIRVVAITVDNAGRISGTNMAVVTGVVPRRRSRR